MDAARYAKVRELLVRLRESPLPQRQVLLDEACAGDEELRREVLDLLRFETGEEDLVRTGAVRSWKSARHASTASSPTSRS